MDRSAIVAYGSETGTAQDVAEEIGKLTRRLHFGTVVAELNDISPSQLVRSDVVIIAIATTGQGELPVNARSLWNKLRSPKLRVGMLGKVRFTSFGVGDSSYPNFNWAHRKLSNRLTQLGAQCIHDLGEADEQHPDGVDGLFVPWAAGLREKLLTTFPLQDHVRPISDEEFLEPDWKLQPIFDDTAERNGPIQDKPMPNGTNKSTRAASLEPVHLEATLLSQDRLTPKSHWQDVRLFEFSSAPVDYGPGDVLTIYPQNAEENVTELLHLMRWDEIADAPVTLIPAVRQPSSNQTHPLPALSSSTNVRTTLRYIIQNHIDLNAIPRRSFFATLAHFASDENQKERLIEFTKPELVDELYDYTTRPRRSILEVLQEFDSVHLPWKWAVSLFPHIRGRQFSIASGGALKYDRMGRTRFQLLVAVVEYRTVIKKLRRGLCTRYLTSLREGSRLRVTLSRSSMQVDLNKPAIMVGPGTGVAPLRAMIHERMLLEQSSAVKLNPMVLVFGNRNRSADFFFEDEFESVVGQGRLRLLTAFSRDQAQKEYVQDSIRKNASLMYSLLEEGAMVYVCGSSGKMPQAVRAALVDVVREQQGGVQDAKTSPEDFLSNMEKNGRYQQETWG